MKATPEAFHRSCATCRGKRSYLRDCAFCDDSGHDHECHTPETPCSETVHQLADQLSSDAEDAAKYRAARGRFDLAVERVEAGTQPTRDVLAWFLGLTLDTNGGGK